MFNITNRKKIGILQCTKTMIRSCSLGSLDKYMNEPTHLQNDQVTMVFQPTSSYIPKRFSENCLSNLGDLQMHNGVTITTKYSSKRNSNVSSRLNSLESLVSLVSLVSLSSIDSLTKIPRTRTVNQWIDTFSNDTMLRDASLLLTAYASSYHIQSPRKDRFEGSLCRTKK